MPLGVGKMPPPALLALHPLQGFVKAYFDGMRKQGFSRKYPVYVASGVLSYNNTEGE